MSQKYRLNEGFEANFEETTDPSYVSSRIELEYLSELLPQLRLIAMGIEEPTLVRLLEMAMLEAQLQLELQIEVEDEFRRALKDN